MASRSLVDSEDVDGAARHVVRLLELAGATQGPGRRGREIARHDLTATVAGQTLARHYAEAAELGPVRASGPRRCLHGTQDFEVVLDLRRRAQDIDGLSRLARRARRSLDVATSRLPCTRLGLRSARRRRARRRRLPAVGTGRAGRTLRAAGSRTRVAQDRHACPGGARARGIRRGAPRSPIRVCQRHGVVARRPRALRRRCVVRAPRGRRPSSDLDGTFSNSSRIAAPSRRRPPTGTCSAGFAVSRVSRQLSAVLGSAPRRKRRWPRHGHRAAIGCRAGHRQVELGARAGAAARRSSPVPHRVRDGRAWRGVVALGASDLRGDRARSGRCAGDPCRCVVSRRRDGRRSRTSAARDQNPRPMPGNGSSIRGGYSPARRPGETVGARAIGKESSMIGIDICRSPCCAAPLQAPTALAWVCAACGREYRIRTVRAGPDAS